MIDQTPTRGERNNNPGNIDRDATQWQGMAADQSNDDRFIIFTAPEFGIRAIGKELLSYYQKHGLNTVRGIINRWAPPVENDTGAYVSAVANQCGVDPDASVTPTDPDCMEQLIRGIIQHENGRIIYDDATIVKSVEDALA